mgnify:CR=1 FL=1
MLQNDQKLKDTPVASKQKKIGIGYDTQSDL